MTERACENCKHRELCDDGCAFFEEKERGPFKAEITGHGWKVVFLGPETQFRYISPQPTEHDACELANWLNERWAERNDEG